MNFPWDRCLIALKFPGFGVNCAILKCANDLNALFYLGFFLSKSFLDMEEKGMPKTKNTNCLLLYHNCCKYLVR